MLNPMFAEVREPTAFAFDEFAKRAARDGSHLVILFTSGIPFVKTVAEDRGIPLVDLQEYIADSGRGDDHTWRHDPHWTPKGHRSAAEALWKYLKERPSLCDPAETAGA